VPAVTTELDVELAKFLQGYARADERVTKHAEHSLRESKRVSGGASGAGGLSLNGSSGQFGNGGVAAGAEISSGISAGMLAGIAGVVLAANQVMNAVKATVSAGAEAVGQAVERGLKFNLEVDNAKVGIANVVAEFQHLDQEASKNVASQALAKIIELEPKTAGTLQDLNSGFMATIASSLSAGLSISENIDLVAKFANGLANVGMPTWQLPQELRSILTGNITKDSQLAKILGITNEDVSKAKEAGNLYELLSTKIGHLGEAGDSATVVFSSLQSAVDKAAGALTKPLFDEIVKGAASLSEYLQTDEFKTRIGEIAKSLEVLGGKLMGMGPEFKALGGWFLDITQGAFNAATAVVRLIQDLEGLAQSKGFRVITAVGSMGMTELARTMGAGAAAPEVAKASQETPAASTDALNAKRALDPTVLSEDQKKAATKIVTELKAIESLHEKIHKLMLGELSPAEKLAELDRDRAKNFEAKNKTGGLFFEDSQSGLEKWASVLHDSGKLEEEAKVLALLEKELEIQKEQGSLNDKMRDQAAKEAEEMAKGNKALEQRAKDRELKLMTPKEQAAKMMEELAKSFGFDVHSGGDVARGLAAKKSAVDDAQGPEAKKKALEDYNQALESATRLEQAGRQSHPRYAVEGQAASALSTIMGGSGQLAQLDEAKKTNSGLDRMTKVLERVERLLKSDGNDDPFSESSLLY
jgi:hypothetical protein